MDKKLCITLKTIRENKNVSQNQLSELLDVDRSTIAHWESGDRIPSAKALIRLAEALEVNISDLITENKDDNSDISVLIVDDELIALQGARMVVADVLPGATISTFKKCYEALEYVKNNKIHIAILDIEIGKTSGFDLSSKIHELSPSTSIIFLTAFPNYALEAWKTPATGFLVKPIKKEEFQKALRSLRPTLSISQNK